MPRGESFAKIYRLLISAIVRSAFQICKRLLFRYFIDELYFVAECYLLTPGLDRPDRHILNSARDYDQTHTHTHFCIRWKGDGDGRECQDRRSFALLIWIKKSEQNF